MSNDSRNLFELACKGVQGLRPYEPGKPLKELEREFGISNAVKLASNENPLGLSPLAQQAITDNIKNVALYPDGNAFYLKKALATHLSETNLSINSDNIIIGNGSNDVLEIIARCFANTESEIIYSQYAFAVYPIVTQAIGATHVVTPAKNWGHDLTAMSNAVTSKTKIIFIANPNNPTGTLLDSTELYQIIKKIPQNIIVVIDEAYHEFVNDDKYYTAISWLSEFQNLIITRTFSKAYGLAGLRIGYGVSHSDITNLLNRVRQPFNANLLALSAAEAALQDQTFIHKSIQCNQEGMRQLSDAFNILELEYIESAGNFIAVNVKHEGVKVYQQLLTHGVIVRPVAAYQMPDFIRVSIGTRDENDRFIRALTEVLASDLNNIDHSKVDQ